MGEKRFRGKKVSSKASAAGSEPVQSNATVKQKSKGRPQDAQKTDSAIATVTLIMGGEEGEQEEQGESVKAVHSSTPCKNLNSRKGQGDGLGRYQREAYTVDTRPPSPKMYLAKRFHKSKQRNPYRKLSEENGSTVHDKEDRSHLPREVLDLLSSQGQDVHVPRSGRSHVASSKLYVATTGDKKKPYSPRTVSELNSRQIKRVTFSSVSGPQCVSKVKAPRSRSSSPGLELNQTDDAKTMPPPPRGYHVRGDSSSRGSSSDRTDADQCSWTARANGSMNMTEALEDVVRTVLKQADFDRLLQGKYKEGKACTHQLAAPLHGQSNEIGVDSEYFVLDRKRKKTVRDVKIIKDPQSPCFFSDSVTNIPRTHYVRENAKNFEGCHEVSVATEEALGRSSSIADTDSEISPGLSIEGDQNMWAKCRASSLYAKSHNERRPRHSRRVWKNANNNSKKDIAAFGQHVWYSGLEMKSQLNKAQNLLLRSKIYSCSHLNSNTNACSGDENTLTGNEGVNFSSNPTLTPQDGNKLVTSAPHVGQEGQSGTEITSAVVVDDMADQSNKTKAKLSISSSPPSNTSCARSDLFSFIPLPKSPSMPPIQPPINSPSYSLVKPPADSQNGPIVKPQPDPSTNIPVKTTLSSPINTGAISRDNSPEYRPIKPPANSPDYPTIKPPANSPVFAPVKPPANSPNDSSVKSLLSSPIYRPVNPPANSPNHPANVPLHSPTYTPVKPPVNSNSIPPVKPPVNPGSIPSNKPHVKSSMVTSVQLPINSNSITPVKPPINSTLTTPVKPPVNSTSITPVKPPVNLVPVPPVLPLPVSPSMAAGKSHTNESSLPPAKPLANQSSCQSNKPPDNQPSITSSKLTSNAPNVPLQANPSVGEGDEQQDKSQHSESEAEGWEAKRHNIMLACNEAIKNRLNRQELADTESKDGTTSDSAPSRQYSESRRRRKTKTTESVYVKFKTSLSKKMTTTTTVKELKQSSTFSNGGKSLILDSDHQSALGVSDQSSDQSLSVPLPRLTRIVKCGEAVTPIRRRRLSSDTEVELHNWSDSSKKHNSASKSGKEGSFRESQAKKKVESYIETSTMEDHTLDPKKPEMVNSSALSPLHKPTLVVGEAGEWDKLSDKASAITVINVSPAASKVEKSSSTQDTDVEEAVTQSIDKPNSVEVSGVSAHRQVKATSPYATKVKDRAKRRGKNYASKHNNGKKAKKNNTKTPSKEEVIEVVEQPKSETSLSLEPKKVSPTTSSPRDSNPKRSNSSLQDHRKRKAGSKKKSLSKLVETSEPASKRRFTSRKRSPEKRKKTRACIFRTECPHKTGSTSSTCSLKKRKSQTTASSISIDSVDDRQTKQKSPPKSRMTEDMKVQETSQVTSAQKEHPAKLQGLKTATQKSQIPKYGTTVIETDKVENQAITEETGSDNPPKDTETELVDAKDEMVNRSIECPPQPTRDFPKAAGKIHHLKLLAKNPVKEKDLQKAEMGWNNSVYKTDSPRTKSATGRGRLPLKRNKLKYFIVKAKDKKDNKVLGAEAPTLPVNGPECKDQQATRPGDQDVKADVTVGDPTPKAMSKTVQFSESIEKVETLKAEHQDDVDSLDELAHENQIGDYASDGSLGDIFITDRCDIDRSIDEEIAEMKQSKAEMEPADTGTSPKRHKRPVWLKKAANKQAEDASPKPTTPKPVMSPMRLEKGRDSFEEVLQSKKCNIQVTYPLQNAVAAPKGEQTSMKTKVAYSSLLTNIFMALPLKKAARRLIAKMGSPVDIKEVTEGSSVDAADYSKALRYSPKAKRSSGSVNTPAATVITAAPSLGTKRKRILSESKTPVVERVSKPGESGSVRSLVSMDSEKERTMVTPNCSFSTDLDEVAHHIQRSVHPAPGSRPQRLVPRKTDKRSTGGQGIGKTVAGQALGQAAGRATVGLPWHLVNDGAGSDHAHDSQTSRDIAELSLHEAGDMAEPNAVNLWVAWAMQEFLNRFNFLNRRRGGHSNYLSNSEHELELLEQNYRVV